MTHTPGFHHQGFVVRCENCPAFEALPAESLDQAITEARRVGWTIEGGKVFCNTNCQREHAGEICRHVWPRSGPNAFICIKCGKHRDEIAQETVEHLSCPGGEVADTELQKKLAPTLMEPSITDADIRQRAFMGKKDPFKHDALGRTEFPED